MKKLKQEYTVTKEFLSEITFPREDLIKQKLDVELKDLINSNFPIEIGETSRPNIIRFERTLFVSSKNPFNRVLKGLDIRITKLEEIKEEAITKSDMDTVGAVLAMKRGLEIAKNIIKKQSEE